MRTAQLRPGLREVRCIYSLLEGCSPGNASATAIASRTIPTWISGQPERLPTTSSSSPGVSESSGALVGSTSLTRHSESYPAWRAARRRPSSRGSDLTRRSTTTSISPRRLLLSPLSPRQSPVPPPLLLRLRSRPRPPGVQASTMSSVQVALLHQLLLRLPQPLRSRRFLP